jgi:hypothetical protein
MAEIYFSGQGVVHVATRDGSGNATVFRDLGNIPSLRLTLETDVLEHKESRTGNRLTDLRLQREKRARVTMTLESFTKANLMMLMYGTSASVSSGTASAEVLPSGLVAGDSVSLSHPLIDAWTSLVDSTGSPLTLVNGTNYTVSTGSGMVTILDPTGFVQPFKANYTYFGEDIVPFFEQTQTERFLRFSGLNTANSNKPVVVELYRVVFDPVGTFDLINDEFAQFEIEGSVLYDSARDTNSALGGFGRIIQAPVT